MIDKIAYHKIFTKCLTVGPSVIKTAYIDYFVQKRTVYCSLMGTLLGFFLGGVHASIYINLACLSICLSVCLYPINVITAEPIGPKFFVGSRVTLGKVYGGSNFQKFASIKIRFLKILKITKSFFENPRNFLFLFF